MSTERSKYLSINITTYVQDLQEEKPKTLMNEIEEGLNEWGDIPHSWVR
jgi:hypothetical protein